MLLLSLLCSLSFLIHLQGVLVSVHISLLKVWCNIIFCLSVSVFGSVWPAVIEAAQPVWTRLCACGLEEEL